MRGLVFEETTLRLSLLRAAALVLVSGRNDLSSGGASDNESAPERTPKTPTHRVDPDVISTVTGQPSGSKRGHSTDEGKFCMKKPRCSTPHEPWTFSNTASSSEDRPLEDAFADLRTSATNYCQAPTAQAHQHIGPTDFGSISSAPLQRSFSMVKHREGAACSSTWSGGLRRVPFGETVATETREYDTGSRGAAPVPAAEINAAQPPDTKGAKHISLIKDVQSIPSQSHQAVSRPIAEAIRTPINSVKRTLRDLLLAGASHRATSTSHSGPSNAEGNTSEQTPESSVPKKGRRSTIYQAAKKLLLSPEGPKSVVRSTFEDSRRNPNMADAPYLSPSWLLERLVHHRKRPSYFTELQVAFECYGYDNVSIPDLKRKALALAHTLGRLGETSASDLKHLTPRGGLIFFALAAEIIHDAFFNGRPLRPDLKTYLRNKLKTENLGKYQLHTPRGQSTWWDGDIKKLEYDLGILNRLIKPRELNNHPLDFHSFFTDVRTLVNNDHGLRRRIDGASKLTDTKRRSRSRNIDARVDKVTAISTKYKKLFNIDLAAEIIPLLKAPPNEALSAFQSALEEGYIPFEVFSLDVIRHSGIHSVRTHRLLGSITILYRRLFESNKTNDLGRTPTTSSDSDVNDSSASNKKSKLNVVQEFLLQQSPALNKEGEFNVKKSHPLFIASEALKFWKEDLNFTPSMPSIPSDIIRQLRRLHAPFGSSQWILTQLIQEHYQGEDQSRCNELQFALDLCGYRNIDIRDVFARAFILAAAILRPRGLPFSTATDKMLEGYVLAADIIQAALFHTWPQHQDLTKYFARHIRYEVLPEHRRCLEEVLAKREEWHPKIKIRIQKGDRKVLSDWLRLRTAKTSTIGEVEDGHPLSFDRFWNDVTMIIEGHNLAIPEIASKYKVLFDRDIIEDLRCIREKAPQICHSNSFARGICEGYVPYRYAQLLVLLRQTTLMINNNSLLFLGALVDYYMSLVCPASATAPQGVSTHGDSNEILSSDDEVEVVQFNSPPRPRPEEQTAQLMAILRRAPTQKPPTAEVAASEPTELHPVAKYLLGRQVDLT